MPVALRISHRCFAVRSNTPVVLEPQALLLEARPVALRISRLRGQKPQAGGADEGDDLWRCSRQEASCWWRAAGAGATGAAVPVARRISRRCFAVRSHRPVVQTRLMT